MIHRPIQSGLRTEIAAVRWQRGLVLAAIVLSLSAARPASADILARYNFVDSNTNTDDADFSTSATPLAVGAGFTTTFSGTGNPAPSIIETYAQINATDRDGAVAANDYFAFTVTPDPGIAMTLSSLTFDAQTGTDSSQAATFWVRTSVDGFIADFTQQSASFTTHTVSLSAPQYANVTSPIEFRIFVSDQGSTDAGAAVRLDNLTLNGTAGNSGVSFGEIFGLKSSNGVPSAPPTALFRFQADGSAFYNLGSVKLAGSPIDADALAGSTAQGLLAFQVTGGNSRLIEINPTTSEATARGGFLAGRDIRGAVFNSSDQLLVIDTSSNQLLTINPVDGTVVGSAVNLMLSGGSFDVGSQTDLAVETDGDLILVHNQFTYRLNPTTGELTQLANSGTSVRYAGAATAASAPNQLFTYDTQADEDIFKLDSTASYARTTLYADILPFFEAGTAGDLSYFVPVAVPEPQSLLVLVPLGACCFAFACCVRRWKLRWLAR